MNAAAAAATVTRSATCADHSPSSLTGVFWFGFVSLLLSTALVYLAAEWTPRKYRVFHHLLTLINAVSALTFLSPQHFCHAGKRAHLALSPLSRSIPPPLLLSVALAGSYLGVVVVDGCVFFHLRYVDLAVTFPLLLLMVGLFSATPLVELLFLSSVSALMFVCQLLAGLHPEHNCWLFFALNLMLALPALSALTSGFRAQAQQRHHDQYVAARVGHVCLLLLLYLIVVQLFLLLSSCLHYIDTVKEATALTIADVVVKVGISLAILFSPELVAKAVEGDPVLHALCGAEMEGEAGEGEAGLETGSSILRSLRMKGGDPAHMRPEPTERSSLRGKA